MSQKCTDLLGKEIIDEFWIISHKDPNKEDEPRFLYYYENRYSTGYSVGPKPIYEASRFNSPETAKQVLNYYLSDKKRLTREQFAIIKVALHTNVMVEHYISLEPTGEQHYEL